MTNPVLHIPAHKQTDPAKQPGQIVNRIDGRLPALGAPYGTATGRLTSATRNIEEVPRAYLKAKAELHPFSTL